jgi:hypothetical protein
MKCLNCDTDTINPKFCSSSCSASYNNIRRTISTETREKIRISVKSAITEGRLVPTINGASEKSIQSLKQNSLNRRKLWVCCICGKELLLIPSEYKKRKYCSTTCRNIHLNPNQRGSRSKAEIYAESSFLEAGFTFTINDRTILPSGKELDFFFPNQKVAIEWNGIYHYKDVNGKLNKIQDSDSLKRKECETLGIELIVVEDFTSHKKFISKKVEELIQYLTWV